MGKQSKIAEMGMLNILNQMKNPLTNIRLCLEMMEKEQDKKGAESCRNIIKTSAIKLEEAIRDLCFSFNELGVSLHIEKDTTPLPD